MPGESFLKIYRITNGRQIKIDVDFVKLVSCRECDMSLYPLALLG